MGLLTFLVDVELGRLQKAIGCDVSREHIFYDKLGWICDGRLWSINAQTNAHAIGVLHGIDCVHDRESTISDIFNDLFVLLHDLVVILFGYDLSKFLIEILIQSLVLQSSFVNHLPQTSFVDSFVGCIVKVGDYSVGQIGEILDTSKLRDDLAKSFSAILKAGHERLLRRFVALDAHAINVLVIEGGIDGFKSLEYFFLIDAFILALNLFDKIKHFLINLIYLRLKPFFFWNLTSLEFREI